MWVGDMMVTDNHRRFQDLGIEVVHWTSLHVFIGIIITLLIIQCRSRPGWHTDNRCPVATWMSPGPGRKEALKLFCLLFWASSAALDISSLGPGPPRHREGECWFNAAHCLYSSQRLMTLIIKLSPKVHLSFVVCRPGNCKKYTDSPPVHSVIHYTAY